MTTRQTKTGPTKTGPTNTDPTRTARQPHVLATFTRREDAVEIAVGGVADVWGLVARCLPPTSAVRAATLGPSPTADADGAAAPRPVTIADCPGEVELDAVGVLPGNDAPVVRELRHWVIVADDDLRLVVGGAGDRAILRPVPVGDVGAETSWVLTELLGRVAAAARGERA